MDNIEIRRNSMKVMTYALMAAFLIDIAIVLKIIRPVFYVADDFQSAVFSGILTFSTLSLTVLSMIIGMMDIKMSGIRLRELLSFKASPIEFRSYLILSMCLSLLGIMALAFGLCTLTTVIAVCTLGYTTYAGITIFGLVSDDHRCRELVLMESEQRGKQFLVGYVYRWLEEYKQALSNADQEELKIYANLLKRCLADEDKSIQEKKRVTEQTDTLETMQDLNRNMAIVSNLIIGENIVRNAIQKQLPVFLEIASESMPFRDALTWTFDELGFIDQMERVCRKFARRISFFDAERLICFDLPGKMDSLLAVSWTLGKSSVHDVCYHMMSCLLSNTAAGEVKNEVLDECVRIMTRFSDQEERAKSDLVSENVEKVMEHDSDSRKKLLILRLFYEKVIPGSDPASDLLYEKLIVCLGANQVWRTNQIRTEIYACMFKGWCMAAKSINGGDEQRMQRIQKAVTREFGNGYSLKRCVCFGNSMEEILNHYANEDMGQMDLENRAALAFASIKRTIDEFAFWGSSFSYRFYLASAIPALCHSVDTIPELCSDLELKRYQNYKFPLLKHLENRDSSVKNACQILQKDFTSDGKSITTECMDDVLLIRRVWDDHNVNKESIMIYSDKSIVPVFKAITEATQPNAV